MGTRHLTAVYVDGQYKIAQYGQWDGYPEGAGMAVLNFARTLADKNRMSDFAERVRAAKWFTNKEFDIIKSGQLPSSEWMSAYPQLNRDTGSDILRLVMSQDPGIKLENEIEFAADSLMCEWVWVIDLDKNTFEGFKGFNETRPLKPDDRFYFLRDKERDVTHSGDKYYGVVLAAKWTLNNLPNDQEFLAAFKKKDEEVEEKPAPVASETFSVQANISLELTKQDIDDIMATALEGGITHWCGKAEVIGDYLGEYASDQISRGGTLKLYDIENPSETWELSLSKLLNGLKMYIESGGFGCVEDGAIETGNIDACAADCIVQYALFGELVFC